MELVTYIHGGGYVSFELAHIFFKYFYHFTLTFWKNIYTFVFESFIIFWFIFVKYFWHVMFFSFYFIFTFFVSAYNSHVCDDEDDDDDEVISTTGLTIYLPWFRKRLRTNANDAKQFRDRSWFEEKVWNDSGIWTEAGDNDVDLKVAEGEAGLKNSTLVFGIVWE